MRIAHFSDPHLLSLAGTRAREFANKRWIGGVNLLANRAREHKVAVFDAMVDDINRMAIDHVLCTGDVTNVALPSEFRFARARFARLDHGAPQLTVIPGNHDAYVAAGVPLFEHHFGDVAAADPEFAWPDGQRWPVVRVRGPVAIIGLTTARQTPWFTAWGELGAGQLERLERVLADPRLAGRFRLIAIHHPPAGEPAEHQRHGLRDHRGFLQVIARTGAELVLHGHEHKDLWVEIAGPHGLVPVRGIQSATYAGRRERDRARYRIYTVANKSGRAEQISEEVRVWDPQSGSFVADSRV
jgi:3',5'-cyclic AMP phosphodiesterase CpdA